MDTVSTGQTDWSFDILGMPLLYAVFRSASSLGGSVCSVLHHLHMHILSLLFPVAHYFIISYVHDYSPFTSTFTLITQCLIVLLYPCSIVVVFCCYAPVYITVCTSCNNLQLTISVQSCNAYHYNRILHLSLTSKAEENLCTWCIVYAIRCQ